MFNCKICHQRLHWSVGPLDENISRSLTKQRPSNTMSDTLSHGMCDLNAPKQIAKVNFVLWYKFCIKASKVGLCDYKKEGMSNRRTMLSNSHMIIEGPMCVYLCIAIVLIVYMVKWKITKGPNGSCWMVLIYTSVSFFWWSSVHWYYSCLNIVTWHACSFSCTNVLCCTFKVQEFGLKIV